MTCHGFGIFGTKTGLFMLIYGGRLGITFLIYFRRATVLDEKQIKTN